MMLTRSFITSYFIVPNERQEEVAEIQRGVDFVDKNGYLHIVEPNPKQRTKLKNAIINRSNVFKSQHDMVEEIMDNLNIEKIYRGNLHSIIKTAYKEELDRDRLYEIVRINYNLMN